MVAFAFQTKDHLMLLCIIIIFFIFIIIIDDPRSTPSMSVGLNIKIRHLLTGL